MGWFAKQEQWCRAQVTKICGVSTGGCKCDGFSSRIPLGGSSVTLMAKASHGLLRELDAMAVLFRRIEESNISDCSERETTSIQVEVKRLDHGDTACLSLCSIKELSPEMASLPLQAVQVSLANVSISSHTMLCLHCTIAAVTHAKCSQSN